VTHAPICTDAFRAQVCPNEWNIGNPPKITSSAVSPKMLGPAVTSAFFDKFACVSSAPFGFPVVPDV
jgi:hypothetical protein